MGVPNTVIHLISTKAFMFDSRQPKVGVTFTTPHFNVPNSKKKKEKPGNCYKQGHNNKTL